IVVMEKTPMPIIKLKVTYTSTKCKVEKTKKAGQEYLSEMITVALQDLMDLSHLIFGANNNQEEPVLTQEEINIEFENSSIVQDILGNNNLY
ncbi:44736_t:CDS:1, partial [Gigaspora margarita]